MQATIDGIEVPIPEDKIPAFSFSVLSLTEPDKIKGSRSTTFTMPATVSVNRALGGPGMAERIDNRRPKLRIGSQGQSLYESIVIPVENSSEEVSVVSVGDNAEWFELARSTRLRELDLGLTSVVDAGYQRASWINENTLAYFPVINYGFLTDRASTFDVAVDKLRPAGRAHVALSKAFSSWGFDLRVNGSLARLWKKFVMPNAGNNIQVDPSQLAGQSARFAELPITYVGLFPNPIPFPTPAPEDDPGGNYVAPGLYEPSSNLTIHPVIDVDFELQLNDAHASPIYVQMYLYDTVTIQTISYLPPVVISEYVPSVTGVFDFGSIDVISGNGIALAIQIYDGFGPTTYVDSINVRKMAIEWTVENIPYQEGYRLVASSLYPDMSVMDLLKAIFSDRCLVVNTNTARGTVDLWQDDEFFQPIDKGINWINRISHEDPPIKQLPIPPVRMEFRWKQDAGDADLLALSETQAAPGYGNHDHVFENGSGEAKRVDMPFAATAMGPVLMGDDGSTMWVPIMRKDGGVLQVDDYKRTPRLLIANGVSSVVWKHDGLDMIEAPVCYFIRATQPYTLAFGSGLVYGDRQPGTGQLQYRYRLQRMVSPTLKALTRIYPDEVWSTSFGTPRLIHDGFTPVWCYVTDIDQFRFTGDDLTETTFIPL